jgi:hypothetical protein
MNVVGGGTNAWMSVCEEGVELDKRLGLPSWLGAYPLALGMSYPT